MTTQAKRDRFTELLCDRAVFKLDAEDQIELAELYATLGEPPGGPDERALERAATAIMLATTRELAPMPEGLADRVLAKVGQSIPPRAGTDSAPTEIDVTPPRAPRTMVMESSPRRLEAITGGAHAAPPQRTPSRALTIAGWLAAAACLLFAVYTWKTRGHGVEASLATAVTERQTLLAHAGTTTMAWNATTDPASTHANGDVVWNEAEQRGYMRFHGLAKNDPKATQYQLWIFDKTRDDKFPVDGGVFDVANEDGDVIVPIRAKLSVGDPALFAITVEKPGGVVVSKRERIVLTAKASS